MKVKIKEWGVSMEIKTTGAEFDVSDRTGHKGDLYVTKKGLIWCQGKTTKKKGRAITWKEFIERYSKKPKAARAPRKPRAAAPSPPPNVP